MERGRIHLVTGGSSGIGRATAAALAATGATVVLTSRSAERGRRATDAIGRGATSMVLDLASMASVRAFAGEFLDRHRALHVLVHNAGVVYRRRTETEDGFEAQLAVIHLGPFLLTELLLDRMKASAPARIVNVASDLHRRARVDPADPLADVGRYHFVTAYARAELLKIAWTYELAGRLSGTGVTANCLHPGGVRTALFRDFGGPLGWLLALSGWLKKGPDAGARTSVHLATAAELATTTGAYFVGRRERPSSPASRDPVLGRAVREASARMTGAS